MTIYQYWRNASHSNIDNFYLADKTAFTLLDGSADEIEGVLKLHKIDSKAIDKIMARVVRIQKCEFARPKNKF